MIDPAAHAVWDEFLKVWPASRLPSMTLSQYTEAGGQDTLVYWLESKSEVLGSVWGGSAFKFGIFSRGNTESKPSAGHLSYDDRYGWYAKYGASAQEAFATIKGLIESIAQTAMQSDLAAIEAIAFSPAIKWKIAFLYQPRDAASIVPIFKRDKLVAYLEREGTQTTEATPQAELYRQVRSLSPDKNILELGAHVLGVSEELIAGKGFSTQAAEAFLSERYGYRRAPTQGVAGFENDAGRQLALVRGARRVRVFLQPPLPALVGLGEAEVYPPERTRTSNLGAQAPLLAIGQSAVLVAVPNMATLERLCDLYDAIDDAQPASMPSRGTIAVQTLPLNLILYGPPGTGKTHATVVKALEAIDPIFVAEQRTNRSQLTERFRQLQAMGRIQFVTFHQSFSYEDFVEGIRATRDEKGQLAYVVEDGIFKKLCIAAAAKVTQTTETALNVSGRTIWKMSLGNTQGEDAYIFDECVATNVALLGYGDRINFTGCKNREEVRKRQLEAGLQPSTNEYSTTAVNLFVCVMKPGDLIVVSDGNHKFRAIGEVKGDYRHVDRGGRDDYAQSRAVIWHRVYEPSLPAEQLMTRVFSQMTLYELRSASIDLGKLEVLLGNTHVERRGAVFSPGEIIAGYEVLEITPEVLYLRKPNGKTLPFDWRMLNELAEYVRTNKIAYEDIRERRALEKVPQSTLEPYIVHGYQNILPKIIERILQGAVSDTGGMPERKDAWVLIIDEINRGNISRIFGELITLIEPSRREGGQEAMSVQLPYSRDPFSVPSNVYLIGTMNTADRSLAGLDIALRRRFRFEEMPPEPDHLASVTVEGVPIDVLMTVLNGRIEALRDSDHCLGHSFFLPLLTDPSLTRLSAIFRGEILPLLEEYFFEDWERIRWVLNDHAKPRAFQFVVRPENSLDDLFGNDIAAQLQDRRWILNEDAFESIESYKGILRS
jgi:5-methylcytosine-specific restriction enzyme B